MKCAIGAATGVTLDPGCVMFDYLLYPCIRVGWKSGLGAAAGPRGVCNYFCRCTESGPGPGPGDIILHCENSFVSTPEYLHWAEQWAVAGIISGLTVLDANSASCEASTQR